MPTYPSYLRLREGDELLCREQEAHRRLAHCDLCAHGCGADRLAGAPTGRCRSGSHARIHSYGPHMGEEDPIRGWKGSGTVFFGRCNLNCVYCQNGDISQEDAGLEVEADELASIFLELQKLGCHNLNLVSPSHQIAAILGALRRAVEQGFRLPIVYNTGGYDSPPALALLDGVVDIYMPDMKYGRSETGWRLSGAPDYTEHCFGAVREMHRQVGDLELDARGVARRGLLVRHLVLPGDLAGTVTVLDFLAREISPDTFVNVMDQYRPCHRAAEFPPLDRRPTAEEIREAVVCAMRLGLRLAA